MTQVVCSLGITRCTCVGCYTLDCNHHRHANLKDLVDDYVEVFRPRLACSLGWYGNAPSLREAIERSALSRGCDSKVHPHQSRWITEQARCEANELLQERLTDIEAARSFESVMFIVEDVARAVSGVGPLTTYDIALRIGWFKGPEFKPEKVYLHAGAKAGAMALTTKVDRVVPITLFPPGLERLNAYEIEDFLCVYKGCLPKLPKARSSRPRGWLRE